jgi:hypothetical protein
VKRDDVAAAAVRLAEHLADKQPGLVSWHCMAEDAYQAIIKAAAKADDDCASDTGNQRSASAILRENSIWNDVYASRFAALYGQGHDPKSAGVAACKAADSAIVALRRVADGCP